MLQSRTEVGAQPALFKGGGCFRRESIRGGEGEGVMARIDLVPSSAKLCTEVSIALSLDALSLIHLAGNLWAGEILRFMQFAVCFCSNIPHILTKTYCKHMIR